MIIGALCRVCLSSYSKMHQIANTEYQELFEKLLTKLSTADQRPETVCYICFSHLQQCRRFVEMSRKAEEILTQFSLNGIQATHETLAERTLDMKENLSMSPIKYLFIGDIDDGSQVDVKEEISVKEEVAEEELWLEIEIGKFVSSDTCNKEDGGIKFEDGHDIATELPSKMDVEQPKLKTTHCGDSCSKTLRETSELAVHTQQSNSRHLPFGCNWCEKKFPRKAYLAIHERVHTGEKTYACTICDKCYFDKSGLIKHKRVHSGEKPFSCNLCGKKFNQKIVLTKHMKVHTVEKPHACEICKKEFKHESSFTKHITRFHSREKPYACDISDNQFHQKSNLTTT